MRAIGQSMTILIGGSVILVSGGSKSASRTGMGIDGEALRFRRFLPQQLFVDS
jgi:hypothetical protein